MKTTSSSTSSSSVFANKSSRESVPPLPSAPRMTTRSSGSNSTTTTHTTTTGGGGGFWIFSFKYYQKYFDVDTADVLRRIKKGTYGALGGALFLDDVKEKPDLYGAFWGGARRRVCRGWAGTLRSIWRACRRRRRRVAIGRGC